VKRIGSESLVELRSVVEAVWLRGLNGVRDKVLLTATAQNLRRLSFQASIRLAALLIAIAATASATAQENVGGSFEPNSGSGHDAGKMRFG
jgi:hypothetical protein